jgi:hypothetical protein
MFPMRLQCYLLGEVTQAECPEYRLTSNPRGGVVADTKENKINKRLTAKKHRGKRTAFLLYLQSA